MEPHPRIPFHFKQIRDSIRPDKKFTDEEAKLLDICMIIHAEHGGGNNSTFTTRCVTSSGTDTYAAIAAGIGSLKGPRHGGANIKVHSMIENMKANISDITNEGQVADFKGDGKDLGHINAFGGDHHGAGDARNGHGTGGGVVGIGSLCAAHGNGDGIGKLVAFGGGQGGGVAFALDHSGGAKDKITRKPETEVA